MRIATGALQVAVAAGLLRAGVASACPTPPDECPQTSELVIAIPLATEVTSPVPELVITVPPSRGTWCDSMALIRLENLSVTLPAAGGGPAVQLSDVRIVRVESLTSRESAARYGSGAFCLWATEEGEAWDQRYVVTVQARDPQGQPHRGSVRVRVVCGPAGGEAAAFSTVEPKTCDPRCVEEIPVPPPPPLDCSQCPGGDPEGECCGSECPEGSICSHGPGPGGNTTGDGGTGRTSSQAGTETAAGLAPSGCAAFPGTGSWGLGGLAMLGVSLALRRRR